MLEKHEGVTVAMPFSDDGRVEVWASTRDALTEKSAKKLVEFDPDFEMLAFTSKQETPATGKPAEKKPAAKKPAKTL